MLFYNHQIGPPLQHFTISKTIEADESWWKIAKPIFKKLLVFTIFANNRCITSPKAKCTHWCSTYRGQTSRVKWTLMKQSNQSMSVGNRVHGKAGLQDSKIFEVQTSYCEGCFAPPPYWQIWHIKTQPPTFSINTREHNTQAGAHYHQAGYVGMSVLCTVMLGKVTVPILWSMFLQI